MTAVAELTTPSADYVEALERITAAAAIGAGGTPSAPSHGLHVRFDDEVESLPPVPWLVGGIIPANALTAIYGAPGAGKSFVALDLALAITAGVSWFGQPTRTGTALYLAAEGFSGLSQRIRAWKSAYNFVAHRLGVGFVTVAIDLLQPATVSRVVDASRVLREPVELVVIDTLARSMVGDENDTGDMSRVVAHADAIRQGTGATVLIVHHTRKDSDLERGSSALRGAVDTLLLCREGDDGRELVCEKQKDAEQFSPIPFRLVAGHGSCIVQASGSGSPEGAREQTELMTKPRRTALCALSEAFTSRRGATVTEWLKASGIPERTFYRCRTWLVENGHVTEAGSGAGSRYTLTPSGRIAATANCQTTANGTAKPLGAPLAAAALASSGGLPAANRPGGPNGSANGKRHEDEETLSLLAEVDERIAMGRDE